MKKIRKSHIFAFLLGAIIVGSIGVYAGSQILASDVDYKDGKKVSDALDDLYSNPATKKFCKLNDGYTADTIGAKYTCEVGNNIIENFFLLAKKGNKRILLAEKNLSDTIGSSRMTWYNAIKFFEYDQPGYAIKQSWTNIISVDLPSAQDIVDASLFINPKENWSFTTSTASSTWWCLGSHEQDQPNGSVYCPTSTAQQKVSWLFDYTCGCASRGCSNEYSENDSTKSNGYWTRDLVGTSNAWFVHRFGRLNTIALSDKTLGVRPVITVLKSNLN